MLGAQGRARAFDGAEGEGLGFGEVAFVLQEAGEIVEGPEGVGVFGAEGAFAAGEGAAQQGFGTGEVAFGIEQAGQIVEAAEGVGMVLADTRSQPARARR